MNIIPNSREPRLFPIASFNPYDRHARRHSKAKIEKLKKLLRHFGQIAPLVIDENNIIISGHALHRAMHEIGANEIAAISIVGCTKSEVAALRLALNRLPVEAAWDNQQLRTEFEELINLSFDLDLTAFDAAEIDHVLDLDLPTANVVEDNEQLPAVQKQPVARLGDIWICGDHRVACGDALDGNFVKCVCNGVLVDVVFTDPPFNIPIAGFVSGKGRNQHREFLQGTGEMSSEEFTKFLAGALRVLQASSLPNALIFACMDWRHIYELLSAGRQNALALYNIAIWAKTNAGMGALYRNQHEMICVFKNGSDAPANNVELGRYGRNRSNLWTYRGLNSFGSNRDELLAAHPTVKPVVMVADVLRDVTKRGGVVLDTFAGAGSTVIAAEETGRRCFSTELDPLYVDVSIRRWQRHTHCDAVHAVTGELFCDRERLVTTNDETRHDK